jgi:hypothetical protein
MKEGRLMASKKELKALITLAGKIDPSLQSAMLKASKMSMKVANDTKKSASALSKVGTIAKGVFIGSIAAKGVEVLGNKIFETGQKGLKLASDLAEVQNVVSKTFGDNENKINDWAQKALGSFGLTELQAKQFNGTLGAMMKSSGITGDKLVTMSEKLTGLAGDFSSFYNLSSDDAFEKIRAGISGETEPLKQLGINMSVANLQAYALSKGIKTSYDKMDQASQVALRYGYLMSVSSDAQGDFANTQGSFANQTRLLTANFDKLAASAATKLLPIATKGIQKANDFIKSIDQNTVNTVMDNVIDKAEKVGKWLLSAFDTAKPTIKWLYEEGIPLATDGLSFVIDKATAMYDFINNNWPSIEPIVWGIVGAVGAYKAITIGATIAQEAQNVILLISSIRSGGLAAATVALEAAQGSATIAQWALNAAMSANPIALVVLGIGALIAVGVALYKNWDQVSAAAGKLWTGIKGAFSAGVNWVIDKMNGLLKVINKIPGIEIPLIAKLQTASDTALNTNDSSALGVEMYATGGMATRPSIFGEAGPEMAIPLERTPRSLGLLTKTAQILGISSSAGQVPKIEININIEAPGNDANTIANTTKSAVEETVLDILDRYFGGEERVSFG